MAAKTSTKTTTKRSSRKPPPPAPSAEPTVEQVVERTMAMEARAVRTPTSEEIARRAFELFVARGGQHGRAQEDWLAAERELRDRYRVS
jgi:hypothetical protein